MDEKRKPNDVDATKLIEQGNIALSNMEFELAIKFFQKALKISPNDTSIMDTLAEVLLQLGESSKSYELLMKSTQMKPDINPSKWCYLAQLQEGFLALTSYKKAIQILLLQLPSLSTDDEIEKCKRLIAKSYCSVADLYMTDLCFENNAEAECEDSVNKSLLMTPLNLDACQTLANLRLSQSRIEDAADIMADVFTRVKGLLRKINERSVISDLSPNADDIKQQTITEDLPDISFCTSTIKLLIECAVTNSELAESAVELVVDLLAYDDDNIELWYLAGVASLTIKSPDLESAKYYLQHASSMLQKSKKESLKNHQEFQFTEQETLVNDHLKIISELEYSVENTHASEEKRDKMAIEKDNEWSMSGSDDES